MKLLHTARRLAVPASTGGRGARHRRLHHRPVERHQSRRDRHRTSANSATGAVALRNGAIQDFTVVFSGTRTGFIDVHRQPRRRDHRDRYVLRSSAAERAEHDRQPGGATDTLYVEHAARALGRRRGDQIVGDAEAGVEGHARASCTRFAGTSRTSSARSTAPACRSARKTVRATTCTATPLTTTQMFTRAGASFDTAQTNATSRELPATSRQVGKARALLNLGQFAAAATAVAARADDVQYQTFHSAATTRQDNGIWRGTVVAELALHRVEQRRHERIQLSPDAGRPAHAVGDVDAHRVRRHVAQPADAAEVSRAELERRARRRHRGPADRARGAPAGRRAGRSRRRVHGAQRAAGHASRRRWPRSPAPRRRRRLRRSTSCSASVRSGCGSPAIGSATCGGWSVSTAAPRTRCSRSARSSTRFGSTYGNDVNFPVPFDETNNPNFKGCIDRNA